jgi:hypothetical protein
VVHRRRRKERVKATRIHHHSHHSHWHRNKKVFEVAEISHYLTSDRGLKPEEDHPLGTALNISSRSSSRN